MKLHVPLVLLMASLTWGNGEYYKWGNVQCTHLCIYVLSTLQHLSKQILAEHAALKGLTGTVYTSCMPLLFAQWHLVYCWAVRDAMCWFVKLWSSLELFGMEFLSCTNTETKDNGLIGVSKDRVRPFYYSMWSGRLTLNMLSFPLSLFE